MAQYFYYRNNVESDFKVARNPVTGTKCRSGQLNHKFVEQQLIDDVWTDIGGNDAIAGEGCRFREGARDGDYVVDVELEVAGFLLAENDGWENIGGAVAHIADLPQKLIVTPDVYTDEMDATTGWSGSYNSLAANSVEKISGEASLKVTSNLGADIQLQKTIAWDLSDNKWKSFRFWFYPHSNPVTTMSSIWLYFSSNVGFTNYYFMSVPTNNLLQNQWNLITVTIPITTTIGVPDWGNMVVFKIRVVTKLSQVSQCSLDFLQVGSIIKPCIMIMFDDGHNSVSAKAMPLLLAKRMSATVFVQSDLINLAGGLTSSDLIDLSNKNFDIGNHTKTHTDLTTLGTEQQVIDEVENCRVFLDGLGLTKASKHVAYPYGSFNANVLTAMATWGAKTGRVTGAFYNEFYKSWPYNIEAKGISNTTTLSTAKGYIDLAKERNSICTLLFHIIVDSNADISTKWLTADFSALLDYIESLGLQTLTIDEYYRLNSGPITVNHK